MSNEATSAGIPMGLTARQAHIAIMAWKALDNEPKVGIPKLPVAVSLPENFVETQIGRPTILGSNR